MIWVELEHFLSLTCILNEDHAQRQSTSMRETIAFITGSGWNIEHFWIEMRTLGGYKVIWVELEHFLSLTCILNEDHAQRQSTSMRETIAFITGSGWNIEHFWIEMRTLGGYKVIWVELEHFLSLTCILNEDHAQRQSTSMRETIAFRTGSGWNSEHFWVEMRFFETMDIR